MTQWVKCLACKFEDRHWNPQQKHGKLGALCQSSGNITEKETERMENLESLEGRECLLDTAIALMNSRQLLLPA